MLTVYVGTGTNTSIFCLETMRTMYVSTGTNIFISDLHYINTSRA